MNLPTNGNTIRKHLIELANALQMDAEKDTVAKRKAYKLVIADELEELANRRAVIQLGYYGE